MATKPIQKKPSSIDWKQSTLFWSCSCLAIAFVLVVVPAMKEDYRWILWFALPFAVVAVWDFARNNNSPSPKLWAAFGGLIIAICLGSFYVAIPPTTADIHGAVTPPAEAMPEAAATTLVSPNAVMPSVVPALPAQPAHYDCPAGTAICVSGGSDASITNNYCGEGVSTCVRATDTKSLKASGNISDPEGVLVSNGTTINPPVSLPQVPAPHSIRPAIAQQPINQTGNCNNAGTFNGPVNQDCQTINQGPPPLPDGLYQSGQLIGGVQGAKVSSDGTTVTFTNLHISSGSVDLKAPINFQKLTVECPEVTNSQQGLSQTNLAFIGDTICTIDWTN